MTSDVVPEHAIRQLGDGVVEMTLPAEPESAAAARSYCRASWSYLAPDVLDDVMLIVSELVSNAVRHGSPEIVLSLRAEPFAIDVAVLDHGGGWPQKRNSDEVAGTGSGRGLAIVDRLAAAWGVDTLEERTGKIVWAAIDRA